MFKYIKLIYLGFLFTAYSHAASQPASLPVGVAKFDGAGIQILTTKDDLSNDNVLICSSMEKKCTPYNGSDFLKGEENSNVEDVSGGKTVFSFDYKKPVSAHYQFEVDVAFIYLKKENLPDIEFYKDNKFKFMGKVSMILFLIVLVQKVFTYILNPAAFIFIILWDMMSRQLVHLRCANEKNHLLRNCYSAF